MAGSLSDDDLLTIPMANLQPGELSRAFVVRAAHYLREENEHEAAVETRTAAQQREETQKETEERELHEREDALLDHIRRQEQKLQEEAEELDKRTIKLDDGRRAYVDGDKYRDAQGRELTGADKAQAEQHHLDQPNAATWQERKDLEEQQRQMERMRHDVEDMRAGKGPADENRALTSYEQDLQAKVAANKAGLQQAPDYGTADYTSELGGLTGNFQVAASGAPTEKASNAGASIYTQNTPKAVAPTVSG